MLEDQFEPFPGVNLLVVGDFDDPSKRSSASPHWYASIAARTDCFSPSARKYGQAFPISPSSRNSVPTSRAAWTVACSYAAWTSGARLLHGSVLDQGHAQFVALLHQPRLEHQRIGTLVQKPTHCKLEASLGIACPQCVPNLIEDIHGRRASGHYRARTGPGR